MARCCDEAQRVCSGSGAIAASHRVCEHPSAWLRWQAHETATMRLQQAQRRQPRATKEPRERAEAWRKNPVPCQVSGKVHHEWGFLQCRQRILIAHRAQRTGARQWWGHFRQHRLLDVKRDKACSVE